MKNDTIGLLTMITVKKRNLFEEIQQGILEMKAHKAGKMRLQTYKFAKKSQSTNRSHSKAKKTP